MNQKSKSTYAWVIKQTKGVTRLGQNLGNRCYVKLGDADNYSEISSALTYATRKDARYDLTEPGEKPVKVRVTIEEV